MCPDHPKGKTPGCLHSQFQWRLGKHNAVLGGVNIQIDVQHTIKPRRTAGAFGPCLQASRVVAGCHHIGIIEQRNFLLGVIGKPHHSLARTQARMGREILQRFECVVFATRIRRFNHHHRIRIKRLKHSDQSGGLICQRLDQPSSL